MVAIYWNPEAYDTSGKRLMGRHAAGEGFMRGYLRHATAPELTLWNAVAKPHAELEPLVRSLEPFDKPIRWVDRGDMNGLKRAGVFQTCRCPASASTPGRVNWATPAASRSAA